MMTNFRFPPPPPPPSKRVSESSYSQALNERGNSKADNTQNRRQGRGASTLKERSAARDHALSSNFGCKTDYQRSFLGAGYGVTASNNLSHSRPPLVGYHAQSSLLNSRPNLAQTTRCGSGGSSIVHANAVLEPGSLCGATQPNAHMLSASSIHTTGLAYVPQSQHRASLMHRSYNHKTEHDAIENPQGVHTGQKRKRMEVHGPNYNGNQGQSLQVRPSRAKAAVPPSIPNYGFTLPLQAPKLATKQSLKSTRTESKKSKSTLGLVQQLSPDQNAQAGEDSDDDINVDEETKLKATLGKGGYAFEHDGLKFSLCTQDEIAAWIKDRKRHFPTRERTIAKAEEANANRAKELKFLREFKDRPSRTNWSSKSATSVAVDDSRSEGLPNRINPETPPKIEKSTTHRKRVHNNVLDKPNEAATVNLGIDYGSCSESMDDSSSIVSESSAESSLLDASESESESASDRPELRSSRAGPSSMNMQKPGPSVTTPQSMINRDRIHSTWKRGDQPLARQHHSKAHSLVQEECIGLYDMLVEQEMVKVDERTLAAIKYLGQHGYLG